MSYTHLTQDERYQIHALKKTGMGIREISLEIGRNRSTVSREFRRNKGLRGYRPKQAHEKSQMRLQTAAKHIKMTPELIEIINELIQLKWSPEQISGRLKLEGVYSISHESIYQHILRDKKAGGDLYTHLRCQKKRRKRYGTKSHDRRGQIKNRVSIEKRPAIVDKKTRIGDWESDTVMGKNNRGCMTTVVDRASKRTKIRKCNSKESKVVCKEMSDSLKGEVTHTITKDNGKEFADHEQLSKDTGAKIFFAHPYCSWERGLNENTNGLIRQFFPKGLDFSTVTVADVQKVEDALNNRPRKSLNYQTPNEVYYSNKAVLERRWPLPNAISD